MPGNFDLAVAEAGIAGTPFAGKLHHIASTASTNTLALEAAQAGVTCGVWIADEQTAGRGRGGHVWHSQPGDGLYVSVLVRPQLSLVRALWLSLATGLAAQAAILEIADLDVDIRWPNDLLLAGKKCGGILVETAMAAESNSQLLRYAVIGIGLNLNHVDFSGELGESATSLRQQSGREWPREPLLSALLCALHGELHQLEAGYSTLLERFAAASSWVRGKRVRVGGTDGYVGITAGLDAKGFLLVDGDDGRRHTVLSGGVRAL